MKILEFNIEGYLTCVVVQAGTRSPKFDARKYAKLVPKFQENNVEEFYQHFEEVAP